LSVVAPTRPSRAFWSFPGGAIPGYLRSLELGELVEDAVHQLTLGAVVSPVLKGAHLGPALLELPLEQVRVRRLPAEAVPVLSKHYGDAAGGHKLPHAVHSRPLEVGPALAGVRHLLKDLVTLSRRVLA